MLEPEPRFPGRGDWPGRPSGEAGPRPAGPDLRGPAPAAPRGLGARGPETGQCSADGGVQPGTSPTSASRGDGRHPRLRPRLPPPRTTPPELLCPGSTSAEREIRPSADVWAFGVLAHVVLTGEFRCPAAPRRPLRRCDALRPRPRGTAPVPGLPDAWREIISDCLARSRGAHRPHRRHGLAPAPSGAGLGNVPAARLPRLRPLPSAAHRPGEHPGRGGAGGNHDFDDVRGAGGRRADVRVPPLPGHLRLLLQRTQAAVGMCSWDRDDADWLSGRTPACGQDRPVQSIFNNSSDIHRTRRRGVLRGRDFTPVDEDVTRKNSGTARAAPPSATRGTWQYVRPAVLQVDRTLLTRGSRTRRSLQSAAAAT
ncbi:hypothetical protein LV779_23230 [Streptomyces thinghirensis]|nr:hypothetical protein [Streptomyces thinghirensis]